MRKIFVTSIMAGCLMLAIATNVQATEQNPDVYVNSKQVHLTDQKAFIQGGRTFVPLRFVSEALGGEVDWNNENQTAIVKRNSKNITMKIGSDRPIVDGEIKTIDSPSQLVNGRTMVPLRFVSEALGARVSWEPGRVDILDIEQKQVVDITGQGEPIAGKPWGKRYFRDQGTIVYKNFSDLNTHSFKINEETIIAVKVTKENITVTEAIPSNQRGGVRVLLYENDNVIRVRDMIRPEDNHDAIYDFRYPVVYERKDSTVGLSPADITKVKYIFLQTVDTVLALNNPMYKG